MPTKMISCVRVCICSQAPTVLRFQGFMLLRAVGATSYGKFFNEVVLAVADAAGADKGLQHSQVVGEAIDCQHLSSVPSPCSAARDVCYIIAK